MKRFLELYAGLPKELRVFIEYILPSAILSALIDYVAELNIDNVLLAGLINLALIFLRELKPRYERLNK